MQRNSVLPFHTETTIFDVFKVSDLTFDLAIAYCCFSYEPVKSIIIFLTTIYSLFPLYMLLTLSNSGNCRAQPLSHRIHILAI